MHQPRMAQLDIAGNEAGGSAVLRCLGALHIRKEYPDRRFHEKSHWHFGPFGPRWGSGFLRVGRRPTKIFESEVIAPYMAALPDRARYKGIAIGSRRDLLKGV